MPLTLYADFSNPESGWPTVSVRSFLRFAKEEVGDSWSGTQLLSLTKQGVIERDIDSGVGKYPASFEGYQRVGPDDIVLCLFDVEETPRTVGLVRQEGMITSAYTRAVLDKKKVHPRYIEYFFTALDDDKRYRPFYNGLRNTIQKPTFLSTRISLPPFTEQRRIADYLDRELAEIDALIAKQEQLITTLDERRGTVISRAVTRGLVEDRPLRDSGVQWMPIIPESWRTLRLPYAASVVSRGYQEEFELLSVYLASGVIPYSDGGGLVHKPSEDLSKYQHVVPGDIVLNNQQAWRGSVGVSRHFGNVSPAYIVMRPITDWHYGYLNYLLRSPFIVTQLEVASRGVGDIQRQLSRPWMREILFPLPSVDEQEEIANYLDDETARIDQLRAEATRMIAILDERRQALISAAVTGKLQVGV